MDVCCSQRGGGWRGTDGCGGVDTQGRLGGRRPEKWGRCQERFPLECCILSGKAEGNAGKNGCNSSPFLIKPPLEIYPRSLLGKHTENPLLCENSDILSKKTPSSIYASISEQTIPVQVLATKKLLTNLCKNSIPHSLDEHRLWGSL